MGMMDVENSILQTIDFKYSTKKIDRDKQMNDFLTKKFHEIYKVHIKMCHFILWNLHNLVWKYYNIRDLKNWCLSTINLKEAVELIKPAASSFYNILINIVLKKYPDELSSASIRHTLDNQILEMRHRGLFDMSDVKQPNEYKAISVAKNWVLKKKKSTNKKKKKKIQLAEEQPIKADEKII